MDAAQEKSGGGMTGRRQSLANCAARCLAPVEKMEVVMAKWKTSAWYRAACASHTKKLAAPYPKDFPLTKFTYTTPYWNDGLAEVEHKTINNKYAASVWRRVDART